ncbi:RNA binding protein, heterogenous nuclear RNP-K like protein [Lobulomyces angularis]|nr:RNA binding protein, heterogenous nuclear RNP-K like protein [Lobulomyces angularis]
MSTTSESNQNNLEKKTPNQAPDSNLLTLRSIITGKEAGIIIGVGGKNVQKVRELTSVKAGVGKAYVGVNERILTIIGQVDNTAKAYNLIARFLLENRTPTSSIHFLNYNDPESVTIRLLVSHQLIGPIIGKGGSKIKDIQQQSGCKAVVSKEMMPQSTERYIDLYGLVDSIQIAVHQIGECIIKEQSKVVGTILYVPQWKGLSSTSSREDLLYPHQKRDGGRYGSSAELRKPQRTSQQQSSRTSTTTNNGETGNNLESEVLETRNVPIPSGMAGCIIGKGGVFVNQIRKVSGCRVSISKLSDPKSEQRIFTVIGTSTANAIALKMLFEQLDKERKKRLAFEDNKKSDD